MSDDYAQAAEPAAAFMLGDNPGLSVDVDDEDNAAGHAILHADSGTMVTFTVFNVGDAPGACTVDIDVDGTLVKSWTSYEIPAKQSESTSVKGLGRYPKGSHEFVAYVTPSAGQYDRLQNNVVVED
jgi:hypothetical protein